MELECLTPEEVEESKWSKKWESLQKERDEEFNQNGKT